jgi:hypothetical protein
MNFLKQNASNQESHILLNFPSSVRIENFHLVANYAGNCFFHSRTIHSRKTVFLAKQENVSWQESDSWQENDSGQESDSGQEKGAGQQENGSWQENDSEHFALLVFKAPRCPSQVATSVGLPLFRGSFRHAASKRPWLDS